MGPGRGAAFDFETHLSRYKHWKLDLEPTLAGHGRWRPPKMSRSCRKRTPGRGPAAAFRAPGLRATAGVAAWAGRLVPGIRALRHAMKEVLRDAYIAGCRKCMD